MERSNINTSIPVEILQLPNSTFNTKYDNKYVTHGKLKIFYIGETDDKRKFTEEFSAKVLKTLPLSPVVAYYNEDDEDFNAHNPTQYVYGFVPKDATIELKTEGDKVWAYTDVILFTGREDNIGKVATKIIGSKHSLELDPKTVDYVINRDEEGNFLNVEFLDGQFIGLSVVGEKETPAFNGSEFFTEERQEEVLEAFASFTNYMKDIAEDNLHVEDGGGENMNKFIELFGEDFRLKLHEYMKETYEERMSGVYEALTAANPDEYVIPMQMNDDTVVYYNYFEGKHYRTSYTIEDNEGEQSYSFSEPVEVKPRYLTDEEIDGTFTTEKPVVVVEDEKKNEEVSVVVEKNFTDNEEVNTDNQETVVVTEAVVEKPAVIETVIVEKEGAAEFTEEIKPEVVEENEKNIKTETKQTTFSESERKELEAFRKEQKTNIISKYAEFLSADDVAKITETISDYTIEELEKELSVLAMKSVMKNKEKESQDSNSDIRAFKIMGVAGKEKNQDPVLALIDQYKD